MTAAEKLRTSVLSSSSARDLSTLFHEVALISGVRDFDLLVPRPCDFPFDIDRTKRLSWFMADDQSFHEISGRLLGQLEGQKVSLPALATFFPNISAANEDDRKEAVAAVINTFRLAGQLREWMPTPVVEIVCGTIVEPASDTQVNVYGVSQKLNWFVQSLEEIVTSVAAELPEFALALELEPGEIYLLNDAVRMRQVWDRCDESELLNKHVGLNVDIAHMRIAGVAAADLEDFVPRFCHSHISDHPGIHTHDQFVGNWTNIEQRDGGYLPYLRQLIRRCDAESQIPFTKCVAIELEGCNRIFSIHDSITRLKHSIEQAEATLTLEAV